jgi:hypothetical protein
MFLYPASRNTKEGSYACVVEHNVGALLAEVVSPVAATDGEQRREHDGSLRSEGPHGVGR